MFVIDGLYPTDSWNNRLSRKSIDVYSLTYFKYSNSAVSAPIPLSRSKRLEGANDSCVSVALGIAKEAVILTVICPSTD
jgi:hypothetical protein